MAESTIHLYDSEDELLNTGPEVSKRDQSTNHSLRTAPVFTSDALEVLGNKVIPQRAVYGSVVSSEDSDIEESEYRKPSKLYVNTNAPFSAVICGLQVRTHLCRYSGEAVNDIQNVLVRAPGKAIRLLFCWRVA